MRGAFGLLKAEYCSYTYEACRSVTLFDRVFSTFIHARHTIMKGFLLLIAVLAVANAADVETKALGVEVDLVLTRL